MYNKVILSGELSKIKHYDNVTHFTIKVTKMFNDKKISNYFLCVAFKSVSNRHSIGDGMVVLLEGELGVNKYEKNSVTMYSPQIVVFKITPICYGDVIITEDNNSWDVPNSGYGSTASSVKDDDIPF